MTQPFDEAVGAAVPLPLRRLAQPTAGTPDNDKDNPPYPADGHHRGLNVPSLDNPKESYQDGVILNFHSGHPCPRLPSQLAACVPPHRVVLLPAAYSTDLPVYKSAMANASHFAAGSTCTVGFNYTLPNGTKLKTIMDPFLQYCGESQYLAAIFNCPMGGTPAWQVRFFACEEIRSRGQPSVGGQDKHVYPVLLNAITLLHRFIRFLILAMKDRVYLAKQGVGKYLSPVDFELVKDWGWWSPQDELEDGDSEEWSSMDDSGEAPPRIIRSPEWVLNRMRCQPAHAQLLIEDAAFEGQEPVPTVYPIVQDNFAAYITFNARMFAWQHEQELCRASTQVMVAFDALLQHIDTAVEGTPAAPQMPWDEGNSPVAPVLPAVVATPALQQVPATSAYSPGPSTSRRGECVANLVVQSFRNAMATYTSRESPKLSHMMTQVYKLELELERLACRVDQACQSTFITPADLKHQLDSLKDEARVLMHSIAHNTQQEVQSSLDAFQHSVMNRLSVLDNLPAVGVPVHVTAAPPPIHNVRAMVSTVLDPTVTNPVVVLMKGSHEEAPAECVGNDPKPLASASPSLKLSPPQDVQAGPSGERDFLVVPLMSRPLAQQLFAGTTHDTNQDPGTCLVCGCRPCECTSRTLPHRTTASNFGAGPHAVGPLAAPSNFDTAAAGYVPAAGLTAVTGHAPIEGSKSTIGNEMRNLPAVKNSNDVQDASNVAQHGVAGRDYSTVDVPYHHRERDTRAAVPHCEDKMNLAVGCRDCGERDVSTAMRESSTAMHNPVAGDTYAGGQIAIVAGCTVVGGSNDCFRDEQRTHSCVGGTTAAASLRALRAGSVSDDGVRPERALHPPSAAARQRVVLAPVQTGRLGKHTVYTTGNRGGTQNPPGGPPDGDDSDDGSSGPSSHADNYGGNSGHSGNGGGRRPANRFDFGERGDSDGVRQPHRGRRPSGAVVAGVPTFLPKLTVNTKVSMPFEERFDGAGVRGIHLLTKFGRWAMYFNSLLGLVMPPKHYMLALEDQRIVNQLAIAHMVPNTLSNPALGALQVILGSRGHILPSEIPDLVYEWCFPSGTGMDTAELALEELTIRHGPVDFEQNLLIATMAKYLGTFSSADSLQDVHYNEMITALRKAIKGTPCEFPINQAYAMAKRDRAVNSSCREMFAFLMSELKRIDAIHGRDWLRPGGKQTAAIPRAPTYDPPSPSPRAPRPSYDPIEQDWRQPAGNGRQQNPPAARSRFFSQLPPDQDPRRTGPPSSRPAWEPSRASQPPRDHWESRHPSSRPSAFSVSGPPDRNGPYTPPRRPPARVPFTRTSPKSGSHILDGPPPPDSPAGFKTMKQWLISEKRCFWCMKSGHAYPVCPEREYSRPSEN